MLRAIFILCIAAAAMADHVTTHEQIVRIGSVGTTFTHVKGVLTPTTPTYRKEYPAFEFKNIVNGVPAVETDKIFFHCSRMNDFYVPHAENPKPVLLCRNGAFEKSSVTDPGAEKMAFLFSAEDFNLPSGVSDIELVLGRGMWKTLVTSNVYTYNKETVRTLRMDEGLYDGYKVVASINPYDTMLTYGVKKVQGERRKRQFGGGFSGSGAQAGASSFGGGGGFGGFPGGGFGGGFSGSQASAGAGSFGGGGGFFG